MVAGCQINTEQILIPDPQLTQAIAASILRVTCGRQRSPANRDSRPDAVAKLGQHAATSDAPVITMGSQRMTRALLPKLASLMARSISLFCDNSNSSDSCLCRKPSQTLARSQNPACHHLMSANKLSHIRAGWLDGPCIQFRSPASAPVRSLKLHRPVVTWQLPGRRVWAKPPTGEMPQDALERVFSRLANQSQVDEERVSKRRRAAEPEPEEPEPSPAVADATIKAILKADKQKDYFE